MRTLNKEVIHHLMVEAARLEHERTTAHAAGFSQGAKAILNTVDLCWLGCSLERVVQETGLSVELVRSIAAKVKCSRVA